VHTERTSDRAATAIFKGLYFLISILVLAAIAYAGWIVARTWDRVGV
jgi:hypothetical protein